MNFVEIEVSKAVSDQKLMNLGKHFINKDHVILIADDPIFEGYSYILLTSYGGSEVNSFLVKGTPLEIAKIFS